MQSYRWTPPRPLVPPAERARCHTDAVMRILQQLARHERQEVVWAFPLDARKRLLIPGPLEVARGAAAAVQVALDAVIRPAVALGARTLILGHNHPTAPSAPSREDLQATLSVAVAAHLVGLELWDHVIVGQGAPYSFRRAGNGLPLVLDHALVEVLHVRD